MIAQLPSYLSSLVFETTLVSFTRLKAFTLAAVGLMTPDNVSRESGDALGQIWESGNDKPLFVDCSGISAFSNYALEGVVKASHRAKTNISFFNASAQLTEEIDRELHSHGANPKASKTILGDEDRRIITYGIDPSPNANLLPDIVREIRKADNAHVRTLVTKSFHANPNGKFEPLHSTPILANGIYNARHIICEPEQFSWIILRLEELLDFAIPDWDPGRNSLLSGSLRACPLAAGLAFMKTPARTVEIIDHLGPRPINLEEHDLAPPRSGLEYIYIGDFIIGGTELKIAANWAARRHCRLTAAVFLGTLWEPERYSLDGIRIHELVRLKDLDTPARYALEFE